jgi:hypothetical protein
MNIKYIRILCLSFIFCTSIIQKQQKQKEDKYDKRKYNKKTRF